MPRTREYPTEQLLADQRAGRLVCQCEDPIPDELTMWADTQCYRCGLKMVTP